MAQVTKWRQGHSNAWPPIQAAALTAPFTIRGKVVKVYPLKVDLDEQKTKEDEASKKVGGNAKDDRPKSLSFTAIELKVASFTRLPADGEDVADRGVSAAEFRMNLDAAFTEYWLGDVEGQKAKGKNTAHMQTGPDQFVFWAESKALSSIDPKKDLAVGAEISLTTECSTLCVSYFGESKKEKAGGIKLNQSALNAMIKSADKTAADDSDGWE